MGQHPLRDRARKLSEGILIVRFELPYNIWCEGCNNHIGMGVRYNAQKKQIGKYYSTPIQSFRMKCHLCDNWFEIHTDPKASDYVIVSGAKRKVETWDPAENGTAVLPDDVEQAKLANNAFFRAEHEANDQQKAKETTPSLEKLLELRKQDWSDPFTLSQKMRKTFRAERKTIEAADADASKVATKNALALPILPRAPEDDLEASHVLFRNSEEQLRLKRAQVQSSSIFDCNNSSSINKRARLLALPPPSTLASTKQKELVKGLVKVKSSATTSPQPPSTSATTTLVCADYGDDDD